MKTLTILTAILASAMSTNLIVAEENSIQLNPMVQIELTTSIKSDLFLASRFMLLDMKDELTDKQNLTAKSHKFMVSEYKKLATNIALIDATVLTSTGE